MTIIGYARVSTRDQDLQVQREALKQAGCTTIRAEKKSGTSTDGRTELATVLEFIREGDTLVVTKLDRPGAVCCRLIDHCRDTRKERRGAASA